MMPSTTLGWLLFTGATLAGGLTMTLAWRKATGRSTKGAWRSTKRRTRNVNRVLSRTGKRAERKMSSWWFGPKMAARKESVKYAGRSLVLWATFERAGEPRAWCSRWVGGTHYRKGSTYITSSGTRVNRQAHTVTRKRRPQATGNNRSAIPGGSGVVRFETVKRSHGGRSETRRFNVSAARKANKKKVS